MTIDIDRIIANVRRDSRCLSGIERRALCDEIERLRIDPHCVDCCCSRSWAALGISEYTGKSIPEEIESLHAKLAACQALLREAVDMIADDGWLEMYKTDPWIVAAKAAGGGE